MQLIDYYTGGGGILIPLFGPLVASLRLGYLKAVSTVASRTSVLQKPTNYSVVLKSN